MYLLKQSKSKYTLYYSGVKLHKQGIIYKSNYQHYVKSINCLNQYDVVVSIFPIATNTIQLQSLFAKLFEIGLIFSVLNFYCSSLIWDNNFPNNMSIYNL